MTPPELIFYLEFRDSDMRHYIGMYPIVDMGETSASHDRWVKICDIWERELPFIEQQLYAQMMGLV